MLDAKTIVFIGAHPDDIEVGCGGTVKKVSNMGKEVYCIIGSNGDKSGNAQTKLQELYTSMDKLGVKRENIFVLNLEDSMISDGSATISPLEELLTRTKPEIIFVTPSHDRHQDHRNISSATIAAARNLRSSILFYETISSSTTFTPKVFIDISETMNNKLDALKSYPNLEKLTDFITTSSKFRGHQANSDYAEGFEVSKYFVA